MGRIAVFSTGAFIGKKAVSCMSKYLEQPKEGEDNTSKETTSIQQTSDLYRSSNNADDA